MDVLRIIEQEGYQAENLNERHRDILEWLRYLERDFEECFEYDNGYDYGIVGDLKEEIAEDVIKQVQEWLAVQIAEYQISFAENEEETGDG